MHEECINNARAAGAVNGSAAASPYAPNDMRTALSGPRFTVPCRHCGSPHCSGCEVVSPETLRRIREMRKHHVEQVLKDVEPRCFDCGGWHAEGDCVWPKIRLAAERAAGSLTDAEEAAIRWLAFQKVEGHAWPNAIAGLFDRAGVQLAKACAVETFTRVAVRRSRMKAALRTPLRSSYRQAHTHTAGTEVELVEPLDSSGRCWMVEIRVPDDGLEGGAWFETLEIDLTQLDFPAALDKEILALKSRSFGDALWFDAATGHNQGNQFALRCRACRSLWHYTTFGDVPQRCPTRGCGFEGGEVREVRP